MSLPNATADADDFLSRAKPFKLGGLPTEQPHPLTRGLAEVAAAQRNRPEEAVRLVQAVDRTLVDVIERVFRSAPYTRLVQQITDTIRGGGCVFCVGCGATGRLSILLDAAWRKACQKLDLPDLEDRVFSVMAGGDFALIKSVEGFEDFPDFGRHQIRQTGPASRKSDQGPRAGDTVIAISEGGETSFVIGAAWEGLDRGAEVAFVFNNPADVLSKNVERSRDLLAADGINIIDLAGGPMAVAGSTRMQATTTELWVVGSAMEAALERNRPDADADPAPDVQPRIDRFTALLDALERDLAVDAIARFAGLEARLYDRPAAERVPVTYAADTLLLDILTDTTERSPTFSLPPFRPTPTPPEAPRPWAFTQHPTHSAADAWPTMLGRPIRGIDWTADDYRGMNAPDALCNQPPKLDADTIRAFRIGNDPLPERTPGLGVAVLGPADDADAILEFLSAFDQRGMIAIGRSPASDRVARLDAVAVIPVDLHDSPMQLELHLAAKLTLNTLSTITMAVVGRMVSNWMVHVSCTNMKLIDRGIRLLEDQLGLGYEEACHALFESMAELRADPALASTTSPVAHTIAKRS